MKHLPLLLIPFMAISCATSDTDNPEPPSLLTLEGYIDDNGYASVLLTSSITPSPKGGSISDAVIRWGKVTLSDGETTVILTGGPDNNYTPPYRYFNHSLTGRAGRTYTITAEYEGRTASAVCIMPCPTPIDSLTTGRIAENDTLRSIMLHFTAPNDCPAYYHVSTRIAGHDSRFYPAMLGCVVAYTPGEHINIPAYRGKHFTETADFTPQWPKECTAVVRLERVTPEVYRFWDAFNNMTLFGGSQFIGTPESLPGNISGGYGVWSAQGTSTMSVKL